MEYSYAFFIAAQTDPVTPAPDQYGSLANLVLLGAPSLEKAEIWARKYVQKTLLDDHPEQKLTELVVIPIHDTIFTHEGTQPIDWSTFPMQAMSKYDDHPHDFHSSGCIINENKSGSNSLLKDWDNLAALKKQVPDGANLNWDETKQFYYLVYSDSCAFVTKSVNFATAPIPFIKNQMHALQSASNITVTVWPGVETYKD